MKNSVRKKVIYLSSTCRGKYLLNWLNKNFGNSFELVYANTDNIRMNSFPDYDLGISFLYTHKIPSTEFKIPFKWVNFHPGLLPDWRGRNLAYHAIMEGASFFGASIHYMSKDFDTGEIIETVPFPIHEFYTAGDLVSISHEILESLFKKYMPLLLEGKVTSYPQEDGNYFKKSRIDNTIELTDEQKRLIRALMVPPRYYPTLNIAGRKYKIVPE